MTDRSVTKQQRIKATREGAGSWTLRIGSQEWMANRIPELKAWTAYKTDDPLLTIGPASTLRAIKNSLEANFS